MFMPCVHSLLGFLTTLFFMASPVGRGEAFTYPKLWVSFNSLSLPQGSPESMQGLILIGYYYGGEGDGKAKHIYTGLARLHAETLSLWDIPKDGSLQQSCPLSVL